MGLQRTLKWVFVDKQLQDLSQKEDIDLGSVKDKFGKRQGVFLASSQWLGNALVDVAWSKGLT